MNTFTKSEVIAHLTANSLAQPKAKYSNATILHMLNAVPENATFDLEATRGGFAFNRGSLVEEIVKSVFGLSTEKAQRNSADINLAKVNKASFEIPTTAKALEVKFATTYASASASMPKTKYVLLITNEGAYLIETAKHKEGKYYSYSFYEGTRLEKLSKVLGF